MTDRFEEVLKGREANYLVPFLWQHGETEEVIREEMARVWQAGISAVCVEARPHPDFLGPRWWRDMDIIMEEARQRGMRVWVLDDDHFPTGHAAGKMKDAAPALRRRFLRESHLDVNGPRPGGAFLVKPFLAELFQPADPGAELVSIVATRRDMAQNSLTGETHDLTDLVQDDFLYWAVPEGHWRIFFVVSTLNGGAPGQRDYLNPIVPESTRVLIESVYEPFFARYAADFGQTFAGFFSDEPGFYNDNLQPYDYQSSVGRPGVTLPWRAGLLELLSTEYGTDLRPLWPLLWHSGGPVTQAVRYTYMNVISRLYGEHFTGQLGDWCRAHGVEYIGHIIEDNGAHTHLGCSAGHYFRALWGQDMAGIDIVLWQLAPGCDEGFSTNVSGEGDGEFYHYGLAKLGSSLAHLDPKKHGRAMCELFGAFGWVEGLKLMKWMTDHLLVRGINYFVPHAFSQADFPDPDCPPHLFARGMNPQYRYYRILNQYTNRVSHLLSGGQHIASAAVLYHAEAEWLGAAMPFQKPVKILMRQQIDCDVLPIDSILETARVINGSLQVLDETYPVLIIPECQALPAKFLARLGSLVESGLPVWFVNRMPQASRDGDESGSNDWIARLTAHPRVEVIPLELLAQATRSHAWHEIQTGTSQPYLRSLHIHHAVMDVYLFTNEHPDQWVETSVSIRHSPMPVVGYDALQNKAVRLNATWTGEHLAFDLRLSPYDSLLVVIGEPARIAAADEVVPMLPLKKVELAGPWQVSTATSLQYPRWTAWRTLSELVDLRKPGHLPQFSGTFRYETEFDGFQTVHSALLDLGETYETAEVWINGQPVGVRICPPYHFEVNGIQPGKNKLVIEVTNTLVNEQQDFLSRFTYIEPSGLLGPVTLG